jgi:hypothetical protein
MLSMVSGESLWGRQHQRNLVSQRYVLAVSIDALAGLHRLANGQWGRKFFNRLARRHCLDGLASLDRLARARRGVRRVVPSQGDDCKQNRQTNPAFSKTHRSISFQKQVAQTTWITAGGDPANLPMVAPHFHAAPILVLETQHPWYRLNHDYHDSFSDVSCLDTDQRGGNRSEMTGFAPDFARFDVFWRQPSGQ